MRLSSRAIFGSLLITVMLGQYVCCLSASAAATTANVAKHSCCATKGSTPRGERSGGKSEPCKHCPQTDASRATITPSDHVNAIPDLTLAFVQPLDPSLASSRLSIVSRFEFKDDPVSIQSDLFHQSCQLS